MEILKKRLDYLKIHLTDCDECEEMASGEICDVCCQLYTELKDKQAEGLELLRTATSDCELCEDLASGEICDKCSQITTYLKPCLDMDDEEDDDDDDDDISISPSSSSLSSFDPQRRRALRLSNNFRNSRSHDSLFAAYLQTETGPNEIIPNLFLGDKNDALNAIEGGLPHFTHLLNVSDIEFYPASNLQTESKIFSLEPRVLHVPLKDQGQSNLLKKFPTCFAFIHSALGSVPFNPKHNQTRTRTVSSPSSYSSSSSSSSPFTPQTIPSTLQV